MGDSVIKKILYLWLGREAPQRQEIIIGEGVEDKPAIPTNTGRAARLKRAIDEAHERHKRIINRWKK